MRSDISGEVSAVALFRGLCYTLGPLLFNRITMVPERFMYDDASHARDFIAERLSERGLNPDAVDDSIILGSGLGNFVNEHMDKGSVEIPFNDIFEYLNRVLPETPIAPSPGGQKGHAQKLVIGPLAGDSEERLVIAQSGREHPYEGVSTKRATFWLRIMQLIGVETLFGSNAVGIVTPGMLPLPSLMLVRCHRDYGKDNPLEGHNEPRFGPRFPHSGDLYPRESRMLVKSVAERLQVPIKEGTLFRFTGPEYENEDTVLDLRAILEGIYRKGRRPNMATEYDGEPVGGTGMSSTYEHLVLQHASPIQDTPDEKHPNRAFGKGRAHVSVGTNYACGLGPDGPGAFPNHDEVKRNAALVQDHFGRLAKEVIRGMRAA